MQETYSELFKLQNLLEKTVQNIAVSNNLKSARSGDAADAAAAGGRPYYPGSPVKGECFY